MLTRTQPDPNPSVEPQARLRLKGDNTGISANPNGQARYFHSLHGLSHAGRERRDPAAVDAVSPGLGSLARSSSRTFLRTARDRSTPISPLSR
jgi:hypothetical protein